MADKCRKNVCRNPCAHHFRLICPAGAKISLFGRVLVVSMHLDNTKGVFVFVENENSPGRPSSGVQTVCLYQIIFFQSLIRVDSEAPQVEERAKRRS